MSNLDIAKRAGIAKSTVAKISQLNRWDSLSLAMIEKFATACGIDVLAPGKLKKFLKAARLDYQNQMSSAQRRMVKRITEDLRTGSFRGY